MYLGMTKDDEVVRRLLDLGSVWHVDAIFCTLVLVEGSFNICLPNRTASISDIFLFRVFVKREK
jgi:hypothetical protein